MTVKSSGYLVSPVSITWASGGLSSLANNGYTALSNEIDNTSNLYLMADIEVYLPSAAYTGSGSAVELFIVPTQDGTNYPNWGTGTSTLQANQNHSIGTRATTGATAAQRIIFRDVIIPPGKWKAACRNRTGVTTPASCTLTFRPHSTQDV